VALQKMSQYDVSKEVAKPGGMFSNVVKGCEVSVVFCQTEELVLTKGPTITSTSNKSNCVWNY
jgi:hypothetical protein